MFHNVLMTSLTPLRNTNETPQCWQNRPFVGIWPDEYNEYKQREIQRPIRNKKRHRTCFTASQLLELEDLYAQNKYTTNVQREQLSAKMNLSNKSIKVWFQNRRMKEKKESDTTSSSESSEITSVVSPAPSNRISSPEEYRPNSYDCRTPADVVDNQHPIANNEAYDDAKPLYQLPIDNVLQQPNPEALDTPNMPLNQEFTEDYFNVYPTSYYPSDYYYYGNAYYGTGISSSGGIDWPTNNYDLNHL